MVAAAGKVIPVFIDTLTDLKQTRRFGEKFGSYPVLRMHDHAGAELAGRIDGNRVAGRIPARQVVAQLVKGIEAFEKPKPKK